MARTKQTRRDYHPLPFNTWDSQPGMVGRVEKVIPKEKKKKSEVKIKKKKRIVAVATTCNRAGMVETDSTATRAGSKKGAVVIPDKVREIQDGPGASFDDPCDTKPAADVTGKPGSWILGN